MSISTSRLSYSDCYEVFESAIADPKGARLCLGTFADANFFRMRMHQARSIHRKDNKEIYDLGHPMHGASIYDKVTLRVKEDSEGSFWVYAEKTELEPGAVEPLSELGE